MVSAPTCHLLLPTALSAHLVNVVIAHVFPTWVVTTLKEETPDAESELLITTRELIKSLNPQRVTRYRGVLLLMPESETTSSADLTFLSSHCVHTSLKCPFRPEALVNQLNDLMKKGRP